MQISALKILAAALCPKGTKDSLCYIFSKYEVCSLSSTTCIIFSACLHTTTLQFLLLTGLTLSWSRMYCSTSAQLSPYCCPHGRLQAILRGSWTEGLMRGSLISVSSLCSLLQLLHVPPRVPKELQECVVFSARLCARFTGLNGSPCYLTGNYFRH